MLNFICPKLSVKLIANAGNIDITKLVDSFTISRPRVDPATPYSWSGSMVLAQPLLVRNLPSYNFLDDLDPTNTYASAWARGNSKIQIYFKDRLFCTLRISEYYFNSDDYKADIDLVDILGLLDFKTPAKTYKGMLFPECKAIALSTVVNQCLTEAGITKKSINIGGNIDVPPDKPGTSWIKFAQSYLGERGYWLYVEPDETVSLCNYNGRGFCFSKSRSQVENFKREKSPQIPPDKLLVVGSGEVFTNCRIDYSRAFPIITETFAESTIGIGNTQTVEESPLQLSQLLQLRETSWVDFDETWIKGAATTKKVTIKLSQQTALLLFPKKYTDLELKRKSDSSFYSSDYGKYIVNTQKSTLTEIFEGKEGRLIYSTEVIDKILGIALPDVFQYSTTMHDRAEVIKTIYSNSVTANINFSVQGSLTPYGYVNDDGVMRSKVQETKALFANGTYATEMDDGSTVPQNHPYISLMIKDKVVEEWADKKSVDQSRGGGYVYTRSDYLEKDVEGMSPTACGEYTYTKKTYSRVQNQVSAKERYFGNLANVFYTEDKPYWESSGLNLTNETITPNSVPQSWTYKESLCPTGQQGIKAIVRFGSVSGVAAFQREQEISFSTLTTLQQARDYGILMGGIQHQRYHSKTINLPLPDQYLIDPTPFKVVNVYDSQFIIDAPNIIYTENELELSFVGNYLGYMTPAIANPPSPPIFTPDPQGNFQLQIPDISALEGEQIAVEMLVFNGTPPFSFSLGGDVVPGLALSSNFIVGAVLPLLY